ncbi:MAG: hypothetical protein ABJN21_18905 [Paracoccaceae bacterium]
MLYVSSGNCLPHLNTRPGALPMVIESDCLSCLRPPEVFFVTYQHPASGYFEQIMHDMRVLRKMGDLCMRIKGGARATPVEAVANPI